MSECNHDLSERETACADGMCPLCLSAELEATRAKLEAAEAERKLFKNLLKRAAGFIGYLAEHIDADSIEIKLDKDIQAALKGRHE
jgi:hypothetical protein